MTSCNQLPPVSSRGRILFVGSAFPPSNGGSMIVMRELLRNFSRSSYCIIAPRYQGQGANQEVEARICRVGARRLRPARLAAWIRLLQVPFLVGQGVEYARKEGVVAVVAPYPSLDMLLLALLISRRLRLPFYPYLHDTIFEALEKTSLRRIAGVIQRRVFKAARRIMVMSEGMADLYRQKYNLSCIPVLHPYHEPICGNLETGGDGKLFWSGNIYGVNDKSFIRVVEVASRLGITTVVATLSDSVREFVNGVKSRGCLIEITAYRNREDYINALKVHSAHILVLNESANSDWGEEELATAFPTKTPEFLASGRPIFVMCPERYSLAKFFLKYDCGCVLTSTATDDEIAKGIQKVLSEGKDELRWRKNAIATARMFEASRVAKKFSSVLDDATEE